jgi:hypothetical protein
VNPLETQASIDNKFAADGLPKRWSGRWKKGSEDSST